MMKILSPKQSMRVTSIYRNFQRVKFTNLQKRWESSKATAKHIRQVAGDLPVAQIQLMQHQCTQLPTGNYSRRKQNSTSSQKPQNCKTPEVPTLQKPLDIQRLDAHSDKCNRCGDTLHVKGFQCPARKFPMQNVPQVWSLYNSVLPEKSRSTLIQLIPIKETKSPTTAGRHPIHPS